MTHDFPCGTRVLDFVSTLRARRIEEPVEFLNSPADLDAWFVESGMLPEGTNPSDGDFAAALELREAVYALMWARLHDRPMPQEAIDAVNAVAAEAPLRPVLTTDAWASTGNSRQALSQLAREAIEIAGGDETYLLRECGRPVCTQIYLDHSRGHRREWCSMSTCGSRMKAKAYRDRKKASARA